MERGFQAFEIDYVEHEKARLARVLQDRGVHLGRTALDYGSWDNTVEYVAGTRPRWADDNLTPDLFANFGVDSIVVADAGLEAVTARADAGELPAALAIELLRGGALCETAMRRRDYAWRFAWIAGQPQLVACAPVQPSDASGAPSGAMAWAIVLDPARVDDLRGLLQFPFTLHEAGVLPEDAYEPDRILAWMPVRDSDRHSGLNAALHLPRPLGPATRTDHAGHAAAARGGGLRALAADVGLLRSRRGAPDPARIALGARNAQRRRLRCRACAVGAPDRIRGTALAGAGFRAERKSACARRAASTPC